MGHPLLFDFHVSRRDKENAPALLATRGSWPIYSWTDFVRTINVWLNVRQPGGVLVLLSKLFADRP